MIRLTDIRGNTFYLNPDHVEKMDVVPDTVLVLTNGNRYMVSDRPEVVIERVQEFKQECNDPVTCLRRELEQSLRKRREDGFSDPYGQERH